MSVSSWMWWNTHSKGRRHYISSLESLAHQTNKLYRTFCFVLAEKLSSNPVTDQGNTAQTRHVCAVAITIENFSLPLWSTRVKFITLQQAWKRRFASFLFLVFLSISSPRVKPREKRIWQKKAQLFLGGPSMTLYHSPLLGYAILFSKGHLPIGLCQQRFPLGCINCLSHWAVPTVFPTGMHQPPAMQLATTPLLSLLHNCLHHAALSRVGFGSVLNVQKALTSTTQPLLYPHLSTLLPSRHSGS